MRWSILILAFIGATTAPAEVSGPQLPAKARITPAQAAMAKYQGDYGALPPPKPCQRPKDGEVVVCAAEGRGGSPERLPLPDERGPRDWARLPTGEVPSMGVGGSPVALPTGTGLTLTLKGGKTTIKGNGAE